MAVVAADLGVVALESGVKGVLVRGESSVLAERVEQSTGVQDRSLFRDNCRAGRGTAPELLVGITKGVRLFGDSGCRV